MNLSRIAKPVAAALLALGVVTVGVAPAQAAAPQSQSSVSQLQDTAWE